MSVRIVTGSNRLNKHADLNQYSFISLAAFCEWLNWSCPRISEAELFSGKNGWWSSDTQFPLPRPGAEGFDMDALAQDVIGCATSRPELLNAYADYEQVRFEVPAYGWHVMILRLSRPVSWYGARLVAEEICEPMGPRTLTADIFELDTFDFLLEGVTAEYRPGVPYFALDADLTRKLYLTKKLPPMLRPQGE